MNDVTLDIDHVWKEYRRQGPGYGRLSEMLMALPRRWRRKSSSDGGSGSSRPFWALRDVAFQVRCGEVVGIVGANGAGKSTLLKILSRITVATRGRVGVRGRVGSLLEVGTGFHPELTGRENIFLNGALLGMKRPEIRRRVDEIVAFAEVEESVDTPVKFYSSGMYVRLAFAVAACLEPDVLLVDEVLAVGDARFQRRCLGRLKEISEEGRTILFVSHNLAAVTGLCTRAVLLTAGQLTADGSPGEIVSQYLSSTVADNLEANLSSAPSRSGSRLTLRAVRLRLPPESESLVTVKTPFDIEVDFEKIATEGRPNVGVYLYNQHGVCLFNAVSDLLDVAQGGYRASVHIPGDFLNNGLHRLRVMLASDLSPDVDVDPALTFMVQDVERNIPVFGEWIGAVRPDLPWTIAELPQP